MTTLRLLADLLLIAPRLSLAWLKTNLPHAPAPVRHCQECGWVLPAEETLLMCHRCLAAAWIAEEPTTKLFCCDVDLEYQSAHDDPTCPQLGTHSVTRRFRCPTCGRIWLYLTDWDNDANSVSDWYPQQTQHDDHTWPYLFDERTRTKVYVVRDKP